MVLRPPRFVSKHPGGVQELVIDYRLPVRLIFAMRSHAPISAEEVSALIADFLKKNPRTNLRDLAVRAGLSYDAVQKYAAGSNAPPPKKWARLRLVLGLSPIDPHPDPTLFQDAKTHLTTPESKPMTNQPPAEEDSTSTEANFVAKPSAPEDRQEFFIPINGFVWFYPEELAIINHPAFQRLDGLHQLGTAHFVYRGATHRRLEHSLGTVAVAQRILEALNHNSRKRDKVKPDPKDHWVIGCETTPAEQRFTRLAALLHDIGHLPYGHSFEDELHLLKKHDKKARLDKVFSKTVWFGIDDEPVQSLRDLIDREYAKYLPPALSGYKPSEIVQRIIIHKPHRKPTNENRTFEAPVADGGLRIGLCGDIVGNTICADLLDYLHRDWYHIGKARHFDDRLFHYMEIRTPKNGYNISVAEPVRHTVDDVFVISIGNRPNLRTDGISAILALLESRYELAEAVLFHRTKMIATSMLERALSLTLRMSSPLLQIHPENDENELNPELEDWLLDHREEELLSAIVEGRDLWDHRKLGIAKKPHWQKARKLAANLLKRNLYDRLLMVTYEEFDGRDLEFVQSTYGNNEDAALKRAEALRLLEHEFNLPAGSITMYCPESRMNSKIAEVRLFVEGGVDRFDDLERKRQEQAKRRIPLSAGHLNAQLERFERLWRIGFFIHPEIAASKRPEFISQLKKAIRVQILGQCDREENLISATVQIVHNLVEMNEAGFQGREVLANPKAVAVAREDQSTAPQVFATKVPIFQNFLADVPESKNS